MSQPSNTILLPCETTVHLLLEIFEACKIIEDIERQLVEFATTSELVMTLELAQNAISQCKDYRLKESLLRKLAAEIVDIKVAVRNRSGEDCDVYRILVLQERIVVYR
ncbi:uncharacterized protein BT62DRAFT_939305 [Guyanagaster necrorhizus]|uniref:Uncharacterized protein n=1 Tax=Guyanagaster necrorhizus TaxID=856835 RepID=A0A9P7VFJ1_9AGAR|nr:uncharacterized protein BT62DRAFT_939305 [Guyanagaster necrorhizus MCA 3950]KAG7439064.1 hypothetical protein BT62DRAFT_939305 [Guyanagaster necrorhizus MCA 3950]